MSKIFFIALSTFKNLVRDRILYNVLFVAFFLLAIGYFASLLTYGNQHRVMLHFGMMINSIAVIAIAVSAGARIIHQETESRILYLILSKPVSRTQYWLGKFTGVGLFLAINLTLLTFVLAVGVKLTGGEINFSWVQAASLVWLEAWIANAFAMWVGLYLTPALTAMVTLTFLFISHNQEQIIFLKDQKAIGSGLLSLGSALFPNAQNFMMDTRIYYDLSLSLSEWGNRFGYGLLWVMIFILIGNALFYRKNL